MKVLILDRVHPILLKGLFNLGFEISEDYESTKEAILDTISTYDGIIVRSRFPINQEFLKAAVHLKFIGRVGAGLENIDTALAKELNIQLFSAPEGNRDAVGEHALGMILMLFNNLKRADLQVRTGIWNREENRGLELSGKTIGIIGYGNMGSSFAKKLEGFDMKILAYDKYKTDFGNALVEESSLEKIKQEAEILSLHIPQTTETIGMVNAAFIEGFKKEFYLINTARGSSVNTMDLVDAMVKNKVLGACLDVLEYEKSSFENMFQQEMPSAFEFLINSDKVILSPHIAGWTQESNIKMAEVILDKIEKHIALE